MEKILRVVLDLHDYISLVPYFSCNEPINTERERRSEVVMAYIVMQEIYHT